MAQEEEQVLARPEMAEPAYVNQKAADDSSQSNQNDRGASPSSANTRITGDPTSNGNKAKSCKGCLYYSSRFKSGSRNPLCVGLTRSLPSVRPYIVGQSEMEASKDGRSLSDFRYACVGYSLYKDRKGQSSDGQKTPTELPVCVGLEVLVDRSVHAAESASAPAPGPAPTHIHNKEDGNALPQRRLPKPASPTRDEFFTRFTRNANLVANGVVKNVRKVGNQIKQSLDDILYPYRRRPK